MEITEIRVFPVQEERLKAYVTITFDDCFVIRDLKVILGNNGLFVAMPAKKRKDGTYKDLAHPINNDFRSKLEKVILETFEKELKVQGGVESQAPQEKVDESPSDAGAAEAEASSDDATPAD